MDFGINASSKEAIAQGLSKLLAESYTLYLKTHKYHWNVQGINFHSLHLMFEQQYTELALAVDTIAERIRVLGAFAPGSYSEFAELSEIKEDTGHNQTGQQMLKQLYQDHATVSRTAKAILPLLEGANDEGTSSMLGARIEIHEKTAWMLRASLE